jgi:DNA-binding transcriptional regulator of glucitol operon
MKNIITQGMIFAAVASLIWGGPAAADDLTESPDGPEHVQVYLDLNQALDKVFPKADKIWSEEWVPTPEERQSLEFALGWRLNQPSFVFHRASHKNKNLGFAMVDEQRGRFKPITFMVHVSPKGEVGRVEVMVYRESRGNGVQRQRFLKQFRGKSTHDPIRMNRDITVLSGATMSSRALTAGVKKALILVERRYLND